MQARPHPVVARPGIERISPNDLTTLATDRGPVPTNIGAVLVMDGGGEGAGDGGAELDLAAVRSLLGRRVCRVPRLRQVLETVPIGAGRPVWVDDAAFAIERHVTGRVAHDETELLRVAADLACTRLPRDRPLWAACWVSGLPDGRGALILVIHHVLTDGLGGLAVLAELCDPSDDDDRAGSGAASRDLAPVARPSSHTLRADAGHDRLVALGHAWGSARAAVRGVRELMVARGGASASTGGRGARREGVRADRRGLRLAARTSLNRPTGSRRRLSTVEVALADVREAAHAHGCTVNDLLLSAIGGAVGGVLAQRGEHPDELVVSVPVSVRRSTTADRLGNDTGVAPVAVPVSAHPGERLAVVAARTSRQRAAGSKGASAVPLGVVFRLLGRMGLFQVFIDHQRLVHTFVTNVRGPSATLHFAGRRVARVVPFALTPGNVGVCFDVLSYAGRLVVTTVADPDVVPEQDLLTQLVGEQITALTRPS
ncbi:hypothetical protein N865_01855 [Intrasporangium oryzae NRRL B-24470]|uniref:diacylglycerol O-acyltransferase n=1 Tax=Intrasporangium oryzae NRRL B-24470 TaxID=1386089 RepID=W9GH23_9MICO|nr:hypothetical protein N865_01855 [Intrasporangium oryzae NRRL B-24470]